MTAVNLVDIKDVEINLLEPLEERAKSFIQQIKNPYHYKYDKYEVSIAFIGNEKLENKLVNFLSKN